MLFGILDARIRHRMAEIQRHKAHTSYLLSTERRQNHNRLSHVMQVDGRDGFDLDPI